jgi:hypothetical protein
MTVGSAARALGAIAVGFLVLGWPASEGWAALTYDFAVGTGVLMNDNLYLDPETGAAGQRKPVKETMFTVAPALGLDWVVERDRLSAGYRGEYYQFSGDEELDARWVHNLAANLNWRRWAPFFLEASESLDYGQDPQEVNVQAKIDFTYTNIASVRTGMVWDLGTRGAVELAYRGELETYPQVENADRVLSNFGELSVLYRWTPLWSGTLTLSYGLVERDLTADYDELSATASVDQRLSERLTLRYGLEWYRDTYDAAPGADAVPGDDGSSVYTNLLLEATVRGALSRGGYWSLGYEDTLEYLNDGDTIEIGRASAELALRARLGSSLTVEGWHDTRDYRISGREDTAWGTTLSARWLITPWAACDLVGNWTMTTIQEEGLGDVEDHTIEAGVGLIVIVFDSLQLEAGYDYRNNDSTDPQRTVANNRLYALMSYRFRPLTPGELPPSYLFSLDSQLVGVNPWDR